MMENISHILQRLPIARGTYSSRNHFGGTYPFKVKFNFDIPIFEGQIDVNSLEKMVESTRRLFLYSQFIRHGKYHLQTP
jgi:hypothetical protein